MLSSDEIFHRISTSEENNSTANSIRKKIFSYLDSESFQPNIQVSKIFKALIENHRDRLYQDQVTRISKENPLLKTCDVALIAGLILGYLKFVRESIHHGANVNLSVYLDKKNEIFITPLHFAALGGNIRCVKLLIELGANYVINPINLSNGYISPLHYAAAGGNVECLTFFLDAGVPIELKTTISCPLGWNWTALQIAASRNRVDCLNLLIVRGADVASKDPSDFQAIHRAVLGGSLLCLNALIQNRADVNASNEDGLTPISIAVKNRDSYCVDTLLKAGANPREKSGFFDRFMLPLQIAIRNKDLNTADVILKFDPSVVDARFTDQEEKLCPIGDLTALHIAATMGYLEGVNLLLMFDANVKLKTFDGKEASTLARENDHKKIEQCIRNYKKSNTQVVNFHEDPEVGNKVEKIFIRF